MKTAPCKICFSTYHTKSFHSQRPRKPFLPKPVKTLKATKPMKQRGTVTNKWLATRRAWLKANPPSHAGYYTCHICGRQVAATDMELDHVLSRSRRPDLRFELSNLKPSHHDCNTRKSSKSLDEL